MRIWLTGGGGMVGRNLLEAAPTWGHEMVAPRRDELDLSDAGAVARWLAVMRPDAVIHAAGKVGGITANIREPVNFLVDNLDIGRNVVVEARRVGITRLINLASSCMYPRDAESPLRENLVLGGPLEETNEGYALAKTVVARLCSYIRREDPRFLYKTLIPCNIYGRYDKFDPAHAHMVPAVIHKIHEANVAQEPTVTIWGDGAARREFLYAGDLADAIFTALDQIVAVPDMMNIGAGVDHSIDDYYSTIAKVLNYRGSFTHDLTKPVGMRRKLVDVTNQQRLGWAPRWSLVDGLADTYRHYLDRRG
ncbi:NAD-dependent epimerase/dehydratase family protein [Sphingomonas sp. DT-51]|uniref:NAD-dependent epimerase/dehydratase family protein n=1 Tax=Sphingomonas sp. DT-51 TaxID=3396165 RepID=UPI003F1B8BA1